MDSIKDKGKWDFSQQSKENFLYSTMTANLAMDYLAKLIEDVVVDSLPTHGAHFVTVSFLSPLKVRIRTMACILGSNANSRSFCKLYDTPSSSIPYVVVKVFLINSCVLITFI